MGRGGTHTFGYIGGSGSRPTRAKTEIVYKTFSKGVAYKRKVIGWDYTLGQNEHFVGIGVITGSITITLPSANALVAGHDIVIKDERGSAGSHPITIQTQGDDTIDGAESVILESSYGAINIYTNGTNRYFIY